MRFDDAEDAPPPQEAGPRQPPGEAELGAVIARLARSHPSGGRVVERAALMAAGPDYGALLEWIASRDGVPEAAPPPSRGSRFAGLHDEQAPRPPVRFVLPAAAFA